MSIVIVGGNERMERRYQDLCNEYDCSAKVFTKIKGSLRDVGNPDLLVLFTGTMSHKLLHSALSGVKGQNCTVVRSHSSSLSALKSILEEHVYA